MKERLRAALEEIEDINAQIQQGGIDPSIIASLGSLGESSPERTMQKADFLLGSAQDSIEALISLIEGEQI